MNNKDILKKYFSIADYIGDINGSNCEVIVHDISDLQHSIIYIVNGDVTGREIGAPITSFALDLITKDKYKEQQSVINYLGKNFRNNKILRSSTYFIRNDDNEIIGLLCVNIDITDLITVKQKIENMIMIDEKIGIKSILNNVSEKFDVSVEEIIDEIIQSTVFESNLDTLSSNLNERMELIGMLHEKGVFRFKGSVNKVANIFGISIQTLYRYLKDFE